MSEPCWINTDNFRAITRHLTTEELGAFSVLMFQYWAHNERLPGDDAALCQLARCTDQEWQRVRDKVVPLLVRIPDFSTDQDMTYGGH